MINICSNYTLDHYKTSRSTIP